MKIPSYLDLNKRYEFPLDVACCPICGEPVLVGDFDEWETETGVVTEGGFHINCKSEPDMDSEEYDDWFNSHWSMPYVDWLPLEVRLYRWFTPRYRLNLSTLSRAFVAKCEPLPPANP